MITAGQQMVVQANANKNKDVFGDIVFNVKAYGAKGNGIADDTVKVQKAIDAAHANGGGTVLFPPGTYLVSGTIIIYSYVRLAGIHSGVSIIQFAANFTLSGPSYGGGQKAMTNANISGDTDISLVSLSLVGAGILQTINANVSFIATQRLVIHDCIFRNFGNVTWYNQALVLYVCAYADITNNEFSGNSGDGLAVAETSTMCNVSFNKCFNNLDYGIAITNNCSDITLHGNTCISNGQDGIGIDECTDVTVIGNTCRGNTNSGIAFRRFDPNISLPHVNYVATGNILRGNSVGMLIQATTRVVATGNLISENAAQGIQINDSMNVTVTGNQVFNQTAAEGILLISYTDPTSNNTIMSNNISNNLYGIRELPVGGTIGPSAIFGNHCQFNTNNYALVSSKFRNVLSDIGNGISEVITGVVNYELSSIATSATAGVASALPATPDGYLVQAVNGTAVKIPFYKF